jgi:hypothetical protein
MAIIYDWIFNPLSVKPQDSTLTDVVITVDWRRTATDGDYASSVYGQIYLDAPDPDNYTDFADLTKSQVQSWVVAALTQETVDQYDIGLAADIERQKNPPVVYKSAPWE